ncbi:MFS transporter [Streptomyces sp. BPTC-684]|uniref:MFS transporter n=1 Tax=Streptomyces sp. BPTC-684 TaxID=3043734 RepID=UPI0024B1B891|nr:MFS transporter [Streptomyces sp. BPTC-684]WHM37866.1 MFS transporter [Streptomyces sp. BPTC-684]
MSVLVRTEGRETAAGAIRPQAGLSTASRVAAVTVLTSLPVFLPGAANGLICAELGWSPVRMGAVLAVYWLASLSGAFVSRRAALPPVVERTLSIALFATCLGLLTAAVAPAVGLWISSAVGGYAYGYTQPHTNALLMRRCAPRLRAFAFGLKQAAVPTATLLASVAMPMLAGAGGWRLVFAGTAVLCGAGGVFLVRQGMRHGIRPGHSGARHPAATRDRGAPLRVGTFLVALSCAGFFGAMVGNGLGGFLVLALTTRGVSLSAAGAVATAGAALNIAVRLAMGWLVGRVPQVAWAALTGLFLTGAAGTALLTRPGLGAITVGALLAYGGGWGWAGLLHYAIALPYAGQEQRATAYSQMGVSLGAATGPLMCGLLFQLGPDAAWWALTAAGSAAGACVLVARGHVGPRPDAGVSPARRRPRDSPRPA